MTKSHSLALNASAKQTKHQQEMQVLREHHERIMKDKELRQATLVGSGVFKKNSDGQLAVAKPYKFVISSKRSA